MNIEGPTFKITSPMTFAWDECKKHEAVIAELKMKEMHKGKEMQNLRLKNHKQVLVMTRYHWSNSSISTWLVYWRLVLEFCWFRRTLKN